MAYQMTYSETFYHRNNESLDDIPSDEMMSLVRVKTEQAISLEGIEARLNEGGQLNIKFGTDPTSPDLHLGHVVPIRVLDIFNRAGHNIDLIFGDFTAKIGDPTNRDDGRVALTDEKIAENMTTFQDQVDRYFDTRRSNVRIHKNSHWLGKMALSDTFEYLQAINLTEATQRKDFRERMKAGQSVSLAETVYGTLMGIDSVHLKTDVEIGGIDQLLNFQQTRTVQRSQGQKAEEIIMTPIIQGTSGDGRKMSKSYKNYIPIRTTPADIFGKVMSITDGLILPYIKAFAPIYESDLPVLEKTVLLQPLEMKKQLATFMTSIPPGDLAVGLREREEFERRFASKNINETDAVTLTPSETILETLFLSGEFKSRSELRRLAEQGGIKINGLKLSLEDLHTSALPETIITVGKRKVYKINDV